MKATCLIYWQGRSFGHLHSETDGRSIALFDEKSYIDATRVKAGEDSYARNAFNQLESDKLVKDRDVPDTRHAL